MSPAAGPSAALRPPPTCIACATNRVAWSKPRVDYCYDCLPGGPFAAPPCRGCGSDRYFSQGLCDRCHPGAPLFLSSCKDCLAWGVYRHHNWLCWTCRWWRQHFPEGRCDYCGRTSRLGDSGACRLCYEQARMLQEPGRALDLVGANKHGQQMFFANMHFHRRKTPRLRAPSRRRPSPPTSPFRPAPGEQLALFEMAPDPKVVRRLADWENSELTRYCHQVVLEHTEKFGWRANQRNDVIRSLKLLQTLRDTPEAKIRASDVLVLPAYDGNIASTLDVLAAAGLLIDDRPRRVEVYFASKTASLPEPMRTELETWLLVLLDGSKRAPRQRQRDPATARVRILAITPIVTAWAQAGVTTLAEITSQDVYDALPTVPTKRVPALTGLRSLFTVLRGRRLIFTDPTRGVKTEPAPRNIPLPLDTAAIRNALASPDPATALAVALIAFHALTAHQARHLLVTDIVDGRLSLDGRSLPLAAPVRVRLTAWLDYRERRWPHTINPHLFLTQFTAGRLTAPSHVFPWKKTTLRPQALREDRILAEAHANGGDMRALCDLFGISIETALRYTATAAPPPAPARSRSQP
ncbi:site-specific recombinase XerD [Promicromonospora sp. AC04]|nr:site-specific recombinase XerD [Promicromonospora sp. AC04]